MARDILEYFEIFSIFVRCDSFKRQDGDDTFTNFYHLSFFVFMWQKLQTNSKLFYFQPLILIKKDDEKTFALRQHWSRLYKINT